MKPLDFFLNVLHHLEIRSSWLGDKQNFQNLNALNNNIFVLFQVHVGLESIVIFSVGEKP